MVVMSEVNQLFLSLPASFIVNNSTTAATAATTTTTTTIRQKQTNKQTKPNDKQKGNK